VFGWRGSRFRLGVRAGVAVTTGGGADAINGAIARADTSCYQAKRAGGRRVAREAERWAVGLPGVVNPTNGDVLRVPRCALGRPWCARSGSVM